MVHRPPAGCARDAHGRSHGRGTARDPGDDAETPVHARTAAPGGPDGTDTTSGRVARTPVMSPLSSLPRPRDPADGRTTGNEPSGRRLRWRKRRACPAIRKPSRGFAVAAGPPPGSGDRAGLGAGRDAGTPDARRWVHECPAAVG